MNLVKAHALGNDFLLLDRRDAPPGIDLIGLARRACERHRGLGADGLIVFDPMPNGAAMQLLNADGSRSEISGNGVRCLAAWLVQRNDAHIVEIRTDAGTKRLELLGREAGRITFRAAMGQPEQIARGRLDVGGTGIEVVTLRVGNPQCVVLGDISEARLYSLAAALAIHPHFPEGTNVELASVEAPDRVRILIWERGVGPTEASGTGACAAAVASMVYGGAVRDVLVAAPGGTQRVEWLSEGLYLTGWAEVIADARWLPELAG
jgi:diaminopimelate epimerase